jgi:hypothetical protein
MKRITLLITILAGLPMTAWAERGDLPYRTLGFYFGAGLGYSNVELDAGPFQIDSGDVAMKAFLGYRLPYAPKGINLAIQGEYIDMGNAHDTPLDGSYSLKIDGYDISAIAFFPITRRWDIMAKAGGYIWDGKFKGWAPNSGPEITRYENDVDLALGIGASFNSGNALGFRLEVENFNVVDGALVASASVTYQFKGNKRF